MNEAIKGTLSSSSMALLTRRAWSSSTTPGMGRRDMGSGGERRERGIKTVTRRRKRIYHEARAVAQEEIIGDHITFPRSKPVPLPGSGVREGGSVPPTPYIQDAAGSACPDGPVSVEVTRQALPALSPCHRRQQVRMPPYVQINAPRQQGKKKKKNTPEAGTASYLSVKTLDARGPSQLATLDTGV